MKLCPKCHKQFSDDANFCPVDAARLAPLEAPSVAADALSSKFELGDKLGGSRTGAVHRATDKATGQPAAVKIIDPAVVALPGLAQRIERELKQLERVQTTTVAKVLASGKRGDDVWVALELIEHAQTLAEMVGARGPMPADQAASLIEVVGEALIEAAQVGVVHRDLAPKNILFSGDDVKLINFSLPVPIGDKAPGVAEFVAPEQHDGKPVDQRSNLYSLGALYYFVLTGQPTALDETGAVKPPSSLVPVAAAVDAMIVRALDKSPTKRFLTVRQFVDEVGRVARGEREAPPAGKPKAELVQTLLGVSPEAPASHAERSPWAPPSDEVAPEPARLSRTPPPPPSPSPSPQPAAPVIVQTAPVPAAAVASAGLAGAAPDMVAPVVAAPVVPPPLLAGPLLAAGKKSNNDSEDARGKFRETLWFKKGELDAQAAQAAAEARARTGKDGGPDKVDSLPIDERYRDDGSLSRTDKHRYSLRTGLTTRQNVFRDPTGNPIKGADDTLIGELKSGRNWIVAAIAAGLVIVAIAVFLIMR
jgi:serine/threonine protein kinase